MINFTSYYQLIAHHHHHHLYPDHHHHNHHQCHHRHHLPRCPLHLPHHHWLECLNHTQHNLERSQDQLNLREDFCSKKNIQNENLIILIFIIYAFLLSLIQMNFFN